MSLITIMTTLLLPLLAWICIYSLDNALTIWSANAFRKPPLADIFTRDGSLELNPSFVAEVDQGRLFGPRFRVMLILSSIYLGIIWYLSDGGGFFNLAYGMLFLLEAVIIIRHFENVAIVRANRAGISLSGRLRTPRALAYRMSAANFMGFALLFLILGFLTWSGFIMGGAIACGVYFLKNSYLARQPISTPPTNQS